MYMDLEERFLAKITFKVMSLVDHNNREEKGTWNRNLGIPEEEPNIRTRKTNQGVGGKPGEHVILEEGR